VFFSTFLHPNWLKKLITISVGVIHLLGSSEDAHELIASALSADAGAMGLQLEDALTGVCWAGPQTSLRGCRHLF